MRKLDRQRAALCEKSLTKSACSRPVRPLTAYPNHPQWAISFKQVLAVVVVAVVVEKCFSKLLVYIKSLSKMSNTLPLLLLFHGTEYCFCGETDLALDELGGNILC